MNRAERVFTLFDAALARPAGEWDGVLADECQDDPQLRDEVESLLAAHQAAQGFLSSGRSLPRWPNLDTTEPLSPALAPGMRLGAFTVESFIGAGGMGEVYRARDTRLDRHVAIKVISPAAAADPRGRARFTYEARAIARLSHPRICALHDVGHQDGLDFLVMEYLQGETLAARLARMALPLDEAIRTAIEIAEALAAAHVSGIVHRDVKPGNVMLTASGVKLLDFGLVRLRLPGGSGPPLDLAGAAGAGTGAGVILGTPQYMAPEQLEGKEVDARADIFSFGAVLYEMVAGRKAFDGDSLASVIAATLSATPPPAILTQPPTPPSLDRVIRTCLRKHRDERWADMHDVQLELQWVAQELVAAAVQGTADIDRRGRPAWRRELSWAIAAILGVALVALVAVGAMVARQGREPEAAPRPSRTTIALPDATLATHAIPVPQIAPDGRRVAFVTSGSGISLRDMDDPTVTALAGTNGARSVFWAPDSEHLAFTTSSAVKTLRVSDGAIEMLCESCEPAGGGTWSANGLIVFAGLSGSLHGVPARGGEVEAVTALDASAGETAHRAPHFLPDGRHFLYTARNREGTRSGLYVGELGSVKRRLLIQGDTQAVYAEPGYVLFPEASALMARPFDVEHLEFTGEASPVVTAEALRNELGGQPAFSASTTGVLTYPIVERPLLQFQWVRRDGEPQDVVGDPDRYYTFDLSADGRRLSYARWNAGDAHLWVRDIERGVTSPLTSGPGVHSDPRWTDDFGLIATRWRPLPQGIVKITPDGGETPLTSTARVAMVEDVSHDGTHLLYREQNGVLLAKPLVDGAEPLLVRRAPTGSLNQASFSPDGRFVAYHEADTSGRFDVYVSPFPPTGEHWQLSARGGLQPMWRHDSQEVYYLELDGTMNAVTLLAGRRPPFSAATRLFPTGLVAPAGNVEEYAVSSDGERFLLLRPVEDRVRSSVGVIFDWQAMLRR